MHREVVDGSCRLVQTRESAGWLAGWLKAHKNIHGRSLPLEHVISNIYTAYLFEPLWVTVNFIPFGN
jgi:hypothetical protein